MVDIVLGDAFEAIPGIARVEGLAVGLDYEHTLFFPVFLHQSEPGLTLLARVYGLQHLAVDYLLFHTLIVLQEEILSTLQALLRLPVNEAILN